MKKKEKYYRLDNILKKNATYNIIYGERSSGKTYAVLEFALERFVKTGKQLAIVRRFYDDFKGKRGQSMFENLVNNQVVSKLTNGEWNGIYYYSMRWFLCRYDSETGKRIVNDTPIAYGFSLSSVEHDKSTSYPNITTVLFDEFITRGMYLQDEFVLWQNTLSTIIRHRTDVIIFMCSNPVNQYNIYIKEMGLTHMRDQEPGTIDVYQYGTSSNPLIVAVEHTKPNAEGKPSDFYFAFDNPKLKTITSGSWELDIYPHCPLKYMDKDVKFIYFIQFEEILLQCEIVKHGKDVFTFVHQKTTDLKLKRKDIVFSTEYNTSPQYRRKITNVYDVIGERIYSFFKQERVYYQSNDIGEVVRNYLLWCGKRGV